MINFNILVDKYDLVWYNTGKDRWDWQGGENLKWREMSYNQPKLTMRQRLDVEPEELDDYPEWQFEKDVVADEFDESSISLFMRYQYILPTRWARDPSAHGQLWLVVRHLSPFQGFTSLSTSSIFTGIISYKIVLVN